ncbi:MAG: helix-turn-helix transcriptional regulator [Acidobacteriota bacterium]
MHRNNLRKLRKERGWAMGRLSAESGVSLCWVDMIELGYINPGMEVREKLARALKVQVDEVFPVESNR